MNLAKGEMTEKHGHFFTKRKLDIFYEETLKHSAQHSICPTTMEENISDFFVKNVCDLITQIATLGTPGSC